MTEEHQKARDEFVRKSYEAEPNKPNGMAATWAYRLKKEREFDVRFASNATQDQASTP
jgi:hypothetical protein